MPRYRAGLLTSVFNCHSQLISMQEIGFPQWISCCCYNIFLRTCVSTYFIKKVVLTNRQDREYLAQAQTKKWNKHDNMGPQTGNLAQTQAGEQRELNQLLVASNVSYNIDSCCKIWLLLP
jgi:hypothetical protein